MVRMKGTYLRFRSVKSSGVNPLILRKRKIVSVGIRIVKQYTTPNTINLYCRGMIRRYENTNRIRNAMKGMENGVNIIEITLAVLIRFLSAIICCSIAIFLFLHYHSTVWIALCRFYFLSLATGMFNCWRYLATVRRAMGYPFSFNISVSSSSV